MKPSPMKLYLSPRELSKAMREAKAMKPRLPKSGGRAKTEVMGTNH